LHPVTVPRSAYDPPTVDRRPTLLIELTRAATVDEVVAAIEKDAPDMLGAERVTVWDARASSDPSPLVDEVAAAGELVMSRRTDGLDVGVPLASRTGLHGVMVVSFPDVSVLDDAHRSRVEEVAEHGAVALERARRYDVQADALVESEDARSRLAFLAEVSNAVASSLAKHEMLDRLCSVGVTRLGDWSTISLADGLALERVAGRHSNQGKQHLVDRLLGSYPVPLSTPNPAARAFRTLEPQIVKVDRGVAESTIDDPEYIETVLALSSGSALIVPLVVRGQPVGVLAFGLDDPDRTFEDADVWLATEMARRAAIGIDNANRFEQEHVVAELLQRAVLPEELPERTGLDLAARYVPAGPGVDVGGDWYDAFALDDGSLALVVGDVAGHDVAAASTMAQLRNALRAYAWEGASPATALGQLNRLLCRTSDARFATAIFAVLSPDGRELRWANAGHPPALVVRAGSSALLTQPRSMLLGVRDDVEYAHGTVALDPNDMILLYTDGLIERRGEELDRGLLRLERVALRVRTRGPGADAVSERVLQAMLAGEPRSDDVCLLCAWAMPAEATVEFALQPDPASSRVARRHVGWVLEDWGVEDLVEPAALLVSELVTNAVVHVGADIRLRVQRLPEGVRVTVFDGSPDTVAARRRAVPPESPSGRGLLIVDNVADRWGVEPSRSGKQVWFELSHQGVARRWQRMSES
jgi:serine phosphatase RsbU (regulator of sigma subunit)/anti-sigma regulatory factor (Ser/Thr protein kinase)